MSHHRFDFRSTRYICPVRRVLTYLLALAFCTPAPAETVSVFAAASLKTALEDLAPAFEAESGDRPVFSFAGTSALARQIAHGAPADVFFSANSDWMDLLDAGGHLAPETRRDLLGNTLVLISTDPGPPLDVSRDLATALGDARLAMALVDAVPAGQYGKAALMSLGLWDALQQQVAQADNVRAALALVALGAAPFGIVYATDARAEPRVTLRATFPEESHPPIRYSVAAIAGRETSAGPFLAFLETGTARAVFEAHGFAVLAE